MVRVGRGDCGYHGRVTMAIRTEDVAGMDFSDVSGIERIGAVIPATCRARSSWCRSTSWRRRGGAYVGRRDASLFISTPGGIRA